VTGTHATVQWVVAFPPHPSFLTVPNVTTNPSRAACQLHIIHYVAQMFDTITQVSLRELLTNTTATNEKAESIILTFLRFKR